MYPKYENNFSAMLSMYVQSYSRVILLLRIAENFVFASRKDFQKNEQSHSDKHGPTEKVICSVFLRNLLQFGINVFRETDENTKLPNFPTEPI